MASTSTKDDTKLHQEIKALEQEEARLDAELKKIDDFDSKSADTKNLYIKCLHEYNEIKDATQAVLGVLANYERVTVGELHKKYLPNVKQN